MPDTIDIIPFYTSGMSFFSHSIVTSANVTQQLLLYIQPNIFKLYKKLI